MTPATITFARRGLWALPIWAGLLVAGTLTHQPDPQTAFADFAVYVTTTQFLVSHIAASIVGAAIGSIGVIALMLFVQDSAGAGRARAGTVATVAGNTLTASIFGVAAFAQPAMGRAFLSGQQNAEEFYNGVYAGPLFATAIVGLLLFTMGGVLTGLAVSGSGRFPRWAGWLYAIATVGFVLSNFIFPPAQSAMAALLLAATVAIAWRARGNGVRVSNGPGSAPSLASSPILAAVGVDATSVPGRRSGGLRIPDVIPGAPPWSTHYPIRLGQATSAGTAWNVTPKIAHISELPDEFDDLVALGLSEEFGALQRMRQDWDSGENRFDGPGEVLLEARLEAHLVGICGLNRDPYAEAPGIGRVRHLYVHPEFRRRGIGRLLISEILQNARGRFHHVRLRTLRADADDFYVAIGFCRLVGQPEATHVYALGASISDPEGGTVLNTFTQRTGPAASA